MIRCAFDQGDSYLACDDNHSVVRFQSPYVWYLRRGRNSLPPWDVTKEMFARIGSVFGIFGVLY